MEFNAAQVPQFQEVIKNKPYVFYGDDNIFPNHLLALYQYSSINRACLNAIIYGVKGKGLYVKEGNPEVLTMANRNETVYEVFEKIVTDRCIFGGFAMNIVKSNDNGIAEFYHTDFSRLRAGKEDDFGNVGSYFYSIDWRGTTMNPNKWKPVEIEAFNVCRTTLVEKLREAGINAVGESYNHTTRDHWKVITDSSIRGEKAFELVS